MDFFSKIAALTTNNTNNLYGFSTSVLQFVVYLPTHNHIKRQGSVIHELDNIIKIMLFFYKYKLLYILVYKMHLFLGPINPTGVEPVYKTH